MTVIILSLAALGIVALVAAVASRWDKGQPDEDPDRTASRRQREAIATTAAMASMKNKKDH